MRSKVSGKATLTESSPATCYASQHERDIRAESIKWDERLFGYFNLDPKEEREEKKADY